MSRKAIFFLTVSQFFDYEEETVEINPEVYSKGEVTDPPRCFRSEGAK